MSFNTIFTKNDKITVRQAADLVQSGASAAMVLPLSFRLPSGAWWQFPIEPLISISGKNLIVRRHVAKSDKRGSIKERWAEDDLQINIQGSFTHPLLDVYPADDLQTLYKAITQRRAIEVKNELLQLLDVHQVVIEPYSFPFSKGENVQNFSMDAYSDDSYNILIEVKNV